MKKILLPAILLTLFISCDKDKDSNADNTNNNTTSNHFEYDDSSYDLGDITEMTNEGYDAESGLYEILFDIYSFDEDNNLYFWMWSDEAVPSSGTYNIGEDLDEVYVDISADDIMLYELFITSGTIDIDINSDNSTMTMHIDGTTDTNKDFSAHFEGSIEYFDESELNDSDPNFKKKNRIKL